MANFVSSVSITPVKRLTSVRRHPIAASPLNFRYQQQEKKTLAPRVGSGLRQIELNRTVLWKRYPLLYRSFRVRTHRTGLKFPFQNIPLAQFVITPTKSPETLKKSNLVSDFIFYGLIIIIIIIIHTYIAPFCK